MDMMRGEQIAQADLADWRNLAQGLHARYRVSEFSTGASFVVAVGQAGDELGHHPIVSIGPGYVDLRLVSDDAIYRDDEGTEHVVQWVTQQDVDLARRIGWEGDASPDAGRAHKGTATIDPRWRRSIATMSTDSRSRSH